MKPNLFQYLDYRRYLRDYYDSQKKEKGSTFSFRSFSRLAGLSSPNFLQLVMEEKRNLGYEGILRFAKGLKLNKEETAYFENLVRFNQATGDAERNECYQKLSRSKRYREMHQIDNDRMTYYSSWHHAAIRELVLLPDFQDDPSWIAQKLFPPVTPAEAKDSLELLMKLGFLKRNDEGRLVQAERNITTPREVESLAVSNFHRQMIRRAYDSLDRTHPSQRDISSLTVAISKEKFDSAKKRIQEFRRELNLLLSEDAEADAVYQINFQIFNLSEVPWGRKAR